MYVACPSCQSLFRIQSAHLRAARGMVRCGVCQNSFDASAAVFDDAQQALAWVRQQVAREIDALVDKALDQVPDADAFSADEVAERARAIDQAPAPQIEPLAAAEPGLEHADWRGAEAETFQSADDAWTPPAARFDADTDFYAQPMPGQFSPDRSTPAIDDRTLPPAALYLDDIPDLAPRTSWSAVAAALLLTLLLLGQYAFVERHNLAADARLRPSLEIFCELLRCDLPLRRDAGMVEMLERVVADHPNVSDALLINALFVNRAGFRQAYPQFQVSFSDVSGTPLALRRFQPREYLEPGKDPSLGMAPGERVQLMLEVIDPGEQAVSFQFDFL